MDTDIFTMNEPTIISSDIAEEMAALTDAGASLESSEPSEASEASEPTETSEEKVQTVVVPVVPDDILTNETYLNGVNYLVDTIDPYSVNEEVYYVDYGTFYSSFSELPDYAVVYQCNGVDVVFPTSYADEIVVLDGMLVNLGSNYTAGLQIDGYNVSNYLSSEITIPTYHSATWYQYLQSYGQPYRIVDRYVNNYGSISSSTRESVFVEWTGGNPWQGFTFDRIALYLIVLLLAVIFIFRKGK